MISADVKSNIKQQDVKDSQENTCVRDSIFVKLQAEGCLFSNENLSFKREIKKQIGET